MSGVFLHYICIGFISKIDFAITEKLICLRQSHGY